MTTWAEVQATVRDFGVDSAEAAKAMRAYANWQTLDEGHAFPESVWQPDERFPGVWKIVPADPRHAAHPVEGKDFRVIAAGRQRDARPRIDYARGG